MFEFLRRMIVPFILVALIAFMATIIFQWGADINSRSDFDSANTAASVNGEEISWQEYNFVYNSLLQTEAQAGDFEDIPAAKKQQLQQQAWQQILQEKLLMQQVAKYNITVSADELYQYLKAFPPQEVQSAPIFATNGQFDYQKYLASLADPSYASLWQQFEPIMIRQIQMAKLQNEIIQTAFISEEEVKQSFLNDNDKVKVGMINAPFNKFTIPSPTPTDEELLAYFNENVNEYQVGRRAVLKVVKKDKNPSQDDWNNKLAQANAIYDSVTSGSDFGEMAKIYSTDGSAAGGGDLGWFERGRMVGPFEDKVFAMEPGEISQPVRTQFGWHVIKTIDFKDDKKQAHAAHILFPVKVSPETIDNFYNTLNGFYERAKTVGFDEAAEEYELEILETTPFTEGTSIPHIGSAPAIRDFAFAEETKKDDMTDVVSNLAGIFVCQFVELIPPGPAPFEEIKSQLNFSYIQKVVLERCLEASQKVYADIESGLSFDEAAKKHDLEYLELDPFARSGFVRGLGRDPKAIGGAFSMTEIGEYTKPIEYGQGSAILKLLDRISPDLTDYTAQKDSIKAALLLTKQQELYGRWYQGVIDNSVIVEDIQQTLASQIDLY